MPDPRTINQPGTGAATQQYELAPGLLQYVQAVYVDVDNSGGTATAPTLTVSEQSGVVIAKKQQGKTIDAGVQGSATWALRLDDEVDTSHSHPIGFYTGRPLGGNPILAATTSQSMAWTFGGTGAGVDLLETVAPSSPSHPTPKVAGLYWMSCQIVVVPTAPGAIPAGASWSPILSVQPADLPPAQFFGQTWSEKRLIPTGTNNDSSTVAILDFFNWTVAIPIYIEMLVGKTAGWALNAFGTLQVQRIY